MPTRRSRLAYFSLGVASGLVAGAGAVLEWQAVDFGGVRRIFGTDTPFGIAVLAMAVAAIVVTLATRRGDTEEPRRWGPPVVLALGILVTIAGGIAASQADVVFDPTKASTAQKVASAAGSTVEEVLRIWEEVTETRLGSGPWVVVAGGILMIAASIAGFRWSRAWRSQASIGQTSSGGAGLPPEGGADPSGDDGAP